MVYNINDHQLSARPFLLFWFFSLISIIIIIISSSFDSFHQTLSRTAILIFLKVSSSLMEFQLISCMTRLVWSSHCHDYSFLILYIWDPLHSKNLWIFNLWIENRSSWNSGSLAWKRVEWMNEWMKKCRNRLCKNGRTFDWVFLIYHHQPSYFMNEKFQSRMMSSNRNRKNWIWIKKKKKYSVIDENENWV